jgi:signal transduction histidine kinase
MLRENFAAIVSHELKSPLAAIQQNLYALVGELSDQLTEDQTRRLDRMKSRITDLLELINTWLRSISVDIGMIKEKFKPISITPVIAKAVESVHPHAIRKNVELVTSLGEPLSLIYGDEGTLTEAVTNICNNAVKYSQPGGEVTLKAEEEDDHVVISIADTGVGIAQEDLPFIFDDFFSRSAGQSAERGHGLGLAISRRIIETHNGSIAADSNPGQGSVFVIRLPKYEHHSSD